MNPKQIYAIAYLSHDQRLLTMRRALAIAFIGWIGLTISDVPPQAAQIKTELKAEQSPSNQSKTNESLAAPVIKSSSEAKTTNSEFHTSHSGEEGTEFLPSFLGMRMKITDSLLVLFTSVLALFTGLLWNSTHKLWTETKSASDTATIAAKAAQKSAEIAERALTDLERPYLFIWGVSRMDRGTASKGTAIYDGVPLIRFQIGNFGRTPATVSYVQMGACKIPLSAEPEVPLMLHDFDSPTIPQVFAPGDKSEILGYALPDAIEVKPLQAGYLLPIIEDDQQLLFSVLIKYRGMAISNDYEFSAHWRYSTAEQIFAW